MNNEEKDRAKQAMRELQRIRRSDRSTRGAVLKIRAKEILDAFRAGTLTVNPDHIRNVVEESGMTLADVGTTKEEFKQFRIDWFRKIGAKRELNGLRHGRFYVEIAEGFNWSSINDLYDKLEWSGLTLADIGTTEEELDRLWVNGCKSVAREALDNLRAGAPYYRDVEIIYWSVERGGFTLADIGTTEEELAQLRRNK